MALEEDNEAAQQRTIERLRHKHEAYVALFGPPGEPTVYGKVVLEDLDVFCTTFRESVHMDAMKRMDPYTTIYRDGKKAVALRIREMLTWSEEHGDSSSDTESG